jgi:hypothetical protein
MESAEIDVDEYLDEASASALRSEVERRVACGDWKWPDVPGDDGVERWTPGGLADDLRNAFYARDASRFEALLTVLEPHERTAGLYRAAEAV